VAIDYSERYVAEQYRSPRLFFVKTAIRLFPLVEGLRAAQRRLLPSPRIAPESIPPGRITDALERSAPDFRRQRWAFIENVFDADFHRFLVTRWPTRRWFTAPFDLHKSYDKGFRWVQHTPATDDRWGALLARDARDENGQYPAYVDHHPHIRALFDYFRSTEFVARVEAFSGRPEPLRFNRFQLTASYPGTLVAPHRDSPQSGRNWLQFLFYVSASGGDSSGGTAILRDNEFRDVVFEPKNLTNSCLVFDPFAPFFHGVRPIAFGKYRWMLAAEYVSKSDAPLPKASGYDL
jgi:hypothetical protein